MGIKSVLRRLDCQPCSECRFSPSKRHVYGFCETRNWNVSALLLVTPVVQPPFASSSKAHNDIVIHRFHSPGRKSAASISRWLYEAVGDATSSGRIGAVARLKTASELSSWLAHSCSLFDNVCLLLVSSLTLPPFLLAALSVKFNGRVVFGTCTQSVASEVEQDGRALLTIEKQSLGERQRGQYVIKSGHSVINYGRRKNEPINFASVLAYLKWLTPDLNDLFILTLFFTNVMAVLSIFDVSTTPIKRLVHFAVVLIKYNLILLIAWLCVSFVANWRLSIILFKRMTSISRNILMTYEPLRSFVMKCVQFYVRPESIWSKLVCLTFLLYNYALYHLRRHFWPSSLREPLLSWPPDWSSLRASSATIWSSTWDSVSPQRYRAMFWSQGVTFTADPILFTPTVLSPLLEKLIHRLGIYSVKAHPSVPYDYVLSLETFKHEPQLRQLKFGAKSPSKLCARCSIARAMGIKSVLRRLDCQPCSKCRFSPSKRHVYGSNLFSSTQQNCSICLEAYKKGDVLCKLPCDHTYHQRCILSWLLRDQPSCPFCRYPAYYCTDCEK